MAVLKCKMCGGDLSVQEGTNIGTCEYCGSMMTLPTEADERKVNLYNRANHFRMRNEFDKAISAYESILEEDNREAEAHWGVVLSRYGIEYVEDPRSGKRLPTCHRTQMAPILEDADYLAALEHAPDGASRSLYEREAREISAIQKRIFSVAGKEEPYDIFLCYKEQSETGQRTRDSVLAQELYYELTEQGYKVFFSRVTLEKKLGEEYEPYIFAALNSARVMLVLGTKSGYFNAVWVKNEWSRFLDLMKQDRRRLLIPCYKDMDPYDLPDALAMMQALDMGKIGFMQDLIHGVKKVFQEPEERVEKKKEDLSGIGRRLSNAETFFRLGRAEEAKMLYQEITRDYPENPMGWLGLARTLSEDFTKVSGEDIPEALRCLKDALVMATGAEEKALIQEAAGKYSMKVLEEDRKILAEETGVRDKAIEERNQAQANVNNASARLQALMDQVRQAKRTYTPEEWEKKRGVGPWTIICLVFCIVSFISMLTLIFSLTSGQGGSSGAESGLGTSIFFFLLTFVPTFLGYSRSHKRRKNWNAYQRIVVTTQPKIIELEDYLPKAEDALASAEKLVNRSFVLGMGEKVREISSQVKELSGGEAAEGKSTEPA